MGAPAAAQPAGSQLLREHTGDWLLELDFLVGDWSASGRMLSEGGPPSDNPFTDQLAVRWSPNGEFLISESTSRLLPVEGGSGRILSQRWGYIVYDRAEQRLLEIAFLSGGTVTTSRIFRLLDAEGRPDQAWQFESTEALNSVVAGQRVRRTIRRTGPDSFDLEVEVAVAEGDWIRIAEITYARNRPAE